MIFLRNISKSLRLHRFTIGEGAEGNHWIDGWKGTKDSPDTEKSVALSANRRPIARSAIL